MYAVIDTETTGLSPNYKHRIIEIGVVLTDGTGAVEHEWSTLLNPDRDLGPQHIHGVRAADVLEAPSFHEIAGHLVELLRGRLIVAHNLPFDLAFLTAEYARIGTALHIDSTDGLCTMTAASRLLPGAGRSLRECCSAADVPLVGWHSALVDAEATAGLLRRYISICPAVPPWSNALSRASSATWPVIVAKPFVARPRRGTVDTQPQGFVAGLIDYLPRVDGSDVADPYLAVLDQALADRYLSADEDAVLVSLAHSLGLTDAEIQKLHSDYLGALARVAVADGVLTDDERADISHVGNILGFPADEVEETLRRASDGIVRTEAGHEFPAEIGDVIVLTGDTGEPRDELTARAERHGFKVHPRVTKQVALVVAADPHSLSGKAKKARGYGIPIISMEAFNSYMADGVPAHQRAPLMDSR